jgi:nucleotidyltransferase substrate binding protein (TIGR01987 family)
MELAERYRTGLIEFEKAFRGFEQGLSIDISQYTAIEADYIRNGWIQKFEYCTELAWKLSKVLLEWKNGQLINAPKNIYRELYLNHHISEALSIALIETINDRNKLSHVYKEEVFDLVLQFLPKHIQTFLALLEILNRIENQDS